MEMLEMNICIKHVGARDIYYQVYDVNYLMEMLEMNISNMLELEGCTKAVLHPASDARTL